MKQKEWEIWDADKVNELKMQAAALILNKILQDLEESERLNVPLSCKTLEKLTKNLCKVSSYCKVEQKSVDTWADIMKRADEYMASTSLEELLEDTKKRKMEVDRLYPSIKQ